MGQQVEKGDRLRVEVWTCPRSEPAGQGVRVLPPAIGRWRTGQSPDEANHRIVKATFRGDLLQIGRDSDSLVTEARSNGVSGSRLAGLRVQKPYAS
jgi:hypothetical protein